MKTTFTETIQHYFAKKQKESVINRIIDQLKLDFEKQAYELANKMYEKYRVDIILKENPDSTLTAMTVIRTDDVTQPSKPTTQSKDEFIESELGK